MYPTLECRDDILKMLDDLTQAREPILARCATLTEAQLNDPVYPGTWSLLKNLVHLAWAEAYMLAWIGKRPQLLPPQEWPPEPPEELPAIRTALDESRAASIAFLKAHPESVLREPCLYGGRSTHEETVGGVYYHLLEHEIHHRAFIRHKLAKVLHL